MIRDLKQEFKEMRGKKKALQDITNEDKKIHSNIADCLMPYRSCPSIKRRKVDWSSGETIPILDVFETNQKKLSISLKNICLKGYCRICDSTRVNMTDIITYDQLVNLLSSDPVSIHSSEKVCFQEIEPLLKGHNICINCTMSSLLTSTPISTLKDLMKNKLPYLLGSVTSKELKITEENSSVYFDSFTDDY
uniref:Protein 3 n=1 Tax=Melilotus virus 1_Off TaxID=2977976 RepID=A0A9N6YJG4_9RHAB|nr:TPA_asm: protein 3 [Melilotus virus 1_Off]